MTTQVKPGMHEPAHYTRLHSGKVIETCDCGATRVDGGLWHTCSLCTHPAYHEARQKESA